MYAPCVVTHHPHISSLDYIYISPSRLPSSMFIHLITLDAHTNSSIKIDERRSIRRNKRSHLLKNISRYASRRREEVATIESCSGHDFYEHTGIRYHNLLTYLSFHLSSSSSLNFTIYSSSFSCDQSYSLSNEEEHQERLGWETWMSLVYWVVVDLNNLRMVYEDCLELHKMKK